jgi:hypothetical protein
MASTSKEIPMVKTEFQPSEGRVGPREATHEAPTTVSHDRRTWPPLTVIGVLITLLVVGGVVLTRVAGDGGATPDVPAQVEGVMGAEMTDAERSLRLHLDAAREARLATASRMTDAEASMRRHAEARREAESR